jgi:hypothetical protein
MLLSLQFISVRQETFISANSPDPATAEAIFNVRYRVRRAGSFGDLGGRNGKDVEFFLRGTAAKISSQHIDPGNGSSGGCVRNRSGEGVWVEAGAVVSKVR